MDVTFVSDVGIQCVPPLIRTMLSIMEGVEEESLVRECLLMMMGACLHDASFLTHGQQSMQAFQAIADICHGMHPPSITAHL